MTLKEILKYFVFFGAIWDHYIDRTWRFICLLINIGVVAALILAIIFVPPFLMGPKEGEATLPAPIPAPNANTFSHTTDLNIVMVDGHYYVCVDCGEVITWQGHTYGCLDCQSPITETKVSTVARKTETIAPVEPTATLAKLSIVPVPTSTPPVKKLPVPPDGAYDGVQIKKWSVNSIGIIVIQFKIHTETIYAATSFCAQTPEKEQALRDYLERNVSTVAQGTEPPTFYFSIFSGQLETIDLVTQLSENRVNHDIWTCAEQIQ